MRSFRILILVLAALCAAGRVSEAQVRTITVQGVGAERTAALVRQLSSLPSLHPDSLARAAQQWLSEEGYLRASVDSVRSTPAGTTVFVQEGKLARVEAVRITGVDAELRRSLERSMDVRAGTVFTQNAVERDIQTMLDVLERQGFMAASIVVDGLEESEHDDALGYAITLKIDPGPLVTVRDVRPVGNQITTSATVTRLSGIRNGQVWSARRAEDARRRLLRSTLFQEVEEPSIGGTLDTSAVITLRVVEGRQNSMDAIAGYLPAQGSGGKGTLTGLVNLQFRNLLGTARRLGLRWFQERQGTQELEASYAEPWVLGSPVGADVRFAQRREDSTFIRQRFTLSASGDVWDDLSVGLSLSSISTIPLESVSGRRMIGSSQTLVGVTATFDTRDDPVTPASGMLYHTDVQTGRRVAAGTSASTGRSRFDAAGYVPFGRTQTGVIEAHWTDVRGSTIDIADLVRFGGATTLRGYREGEFLASRVIWATAEARFLLSARSYAAAFLDAATIERPALPADGMSASALTRFGYGVGLRIDAPVGLISVSFAWGRSDGIGDAKLHLRIQNEF